MVRSSHCTVHTGTGRRPRPEQRHHAWTDPTWLVTDEQSQIRKIIAASVDYNSYFGAGVGLSIYGYRSEDTQWTAIAGVNQHVERNVDYDYQTGRLRNTTRSFDARAVYDRSGTPRYYGIGNNSPIYNETDYTLLQKYAQAMVGWNLSHVCRSLTRCAIATSTWSRGPSPESSRCKVASGRSWVSGLLTKRCTDSRSSTIRATTRRFRPAADNT
jgi:hypothetical protein